jgi:4-phosphopantoate--beta-alanine ligase
MKRDKLIEAYKTGMVAEAGMIAHGRGEAFDYLLGECTIPEAEEAEMVAASLLLNAKNPVISINGNVAALCPEALVELANAIPAKLEVNIFYRTDERMKKLVKHLEDHGAKNVLGLEPDAQIPGLEHARGLCTKEGIFSADVILVPLEDGDRAQALRKMGKTTIVIDLNPLSRTARAASVTIVDEITRAIPNIMEFAAEMKGQPVPRFDNAVNLRKAIDRITNALFELRCAYGPG